MRRRNSPRQAGSSSLPSTRTWVVGAFTKGLPFPVSIPNEQTIAAMREANTPTNLKRCRSFHELRDQI
ncbi:MAG: hypothetical protein ABSG65_34905 [Bryobacteraceae bacterium]|jgi:hypothetical protein